MLSEDYSLIDIEFCISPTVPPESSLVTRAMAEEFFFCPVYFISHLRKERAAATTFLDEDAVPVELELINAVNAFHGRDDRYFYVSYV